MHFTRDPIIESVITSREGCKLVIRNSKGVGQEEHFVDAVEVVNFGSACFFRSLERPKPFLVPCTDYEVLEVRETRMVLRHAAATEKSIKITGKAEDKPTRSKRAPRKKEKEKEKETEKEKDKEQEKESEDTVTAPKKERRKRRRKPRESTKEEKANADEGTPSTNEPSSMPQVIPPPKALISESIGRYKEMLVPGENEASKAISSEKDVVSTDES